MESYRLELGIPSHDEDAEKENLRWANLMEVVKQLRLSEFDGTVDYDKDIRGFVAHYFADLIAWLLSPPNECSRSAKEAYYDCVIARPFLRKVIPNNKEHVFSSFVHTMHEDRSQEEAEFAETHCIHCGAKWRKS